MSRFSTDHQFEENKRARPRYRLTVHTITINDYRLDVIHQFTYPGSTVTDSLSLETEINKGIGCSGTAFTKLNKRVWENSRLTNKTKVAVYRACVLICSFGIKWHDHLTNIRGRRSLRDPQYLLPAKAAQTPMAWSCPPHGQWEDSQRRPLWRTGHRFKISRTLLPSPDGCLQERSEAA